MRFDGQRVRAGDQLVRGDEDQLSVGARGGRRDGGVREGRGVNRSVSHTLAGDLGAIDVHHGTVVRRHGDVHAADSARVSDRKVDTRVGGDGAGLGRARGQRRVESGATVADRRSAAVPGGVVERGLGPVLGDRIGRPVVRPGVVLIHEQRGVVGLGGLAVGVDRVDVGRGTAQAIGGHRAYEEAVLASQGHGHGVRGRGGDRTIITQNVVGDGTGHGGPLEGDFLGVAVGGAQVRGDCGGGGVAGGHAHEAAGPLACREGGVGVVEVAAGPKGAVVSHFEGPRAGGAQGSEAVGGPAKLAARGLVPAADPLDLVGSCPRGAERQVLVGVLEGEVGAVARGVDDARGRAGGRL